MQIREAVMCHRFRLWKQLAYSRACTHSTLSSRSFQPPPLFRLCYAPKLITAPSLMKANPVSRHCGGGGGSGGGRPEHGKASRGCLLQGLSEWLSEEMPESVNVSANLEVCKVFYIEAELFGDCLLALNTLNAGLSKLVMACNNSF